MNFRIDETFIAIYDGLGVPWLLAALGILAYALVGNFLRAFGLAVLLLICAQSWYTPAFVLGRGLRWYVLLLVCLRGVLLASRIPRPEGERGPGRLIASALGILAVTSSLWADNPSYTFATAISFTVSIVVSFWVLWRVMDTQDVVAASCRGALWLSLVLFGVSFSWWGLAQWLPGVRAPDWMFRGGRFAGLLFNPNMLGLLAMVLIPPLVAAPRSWLGRGARLRFLTIGLASAALYLSGSRSALLGTVVSLVLLFLYRFGFGAILTVAIATLGVYFLATTSSIEDIDATSVGHFARTKHIHTLSGRLELWEEGLEAAEGHMVLGRGWGSSRLLGGADPDEALERGNVARATNLHSTPVQLLVDLGVVGLGLLWLLCAQVLLAGWRLLLQPRSERSIGAVMVLGCFTATFADSFVHGSVLSTGSPSALIFWSSAVVLLKEAARLRPGFGALEVSQGAWPDPRPVPR